MKILRTENSLSEFQGNKRYGLNEVAKKKRRRPDFSKILEQTLNEFNEEPEEFRILLPRNGHFWDNGYEDLG